MTFNRFAGLGTCTLSERSFFARAPLGCDVSRAGNGMSAMTVLRFASAARAGSVSRPSSLWRPTKCVWMFGRRPGAPCSDTANTSVPWKESLQGTTRLYSKAGRLSRVITTRSRSHWSGSARGPFPGMPPSPSDPLALLDRLPQRRLHHRAGNGVSAHLEDRANQALDTEPGMLPGAVAHRQSLNFWCMLADRSCRGSEHLHAEESAAGMRTLSFIPRRVTSCRAIARVGRSIQGYASGN